MKVIDKITELKIAETAYQIASACDYVQENTRDKKDEERKWFYKIS